MNLRHTLRVNARLNLEVIRATRDHLADDLEKALIYATVSASNVGHLDDDPAIARAFAHAPFPDNLRRPIRVQRIAESLGIPRETTRVKTRQLIEDGLVKVTPEGLLTDTNQVQTPRLVPMIQRYVASMAQAVEYLAAVGACGLTHETRLAPLSPAWAWGATRVITQHALRGVADLIGYVKPGTVMQAYLFLAVLDHAGSPFNVPPHFPYRNHADYPPDAERLTISASALAVQLGLPRETVRRNLQALVGRGLLYHGDSGFGMTTPESTEERRQDWLVQTRCDNDMTRLIRKLSYIGALSEPVDRASA